MCADVKAIGRLSPPDYWGSMSTFRRRRTGGFGFFYFDVADDGIGFQQ